MKIAIFGAGKLGTRIAAALVDGDYDITIIDSNEGKLNHLSQNMDVFTYAADAKNIQTLKNIDIKSYDFVMCAMSSDETNLLVASFAKALGCEQVAARVREPEFMGQIDFMRQHLNINYLLNPDLLITSEIQRYLVEKYSLTSGVFTMGGCAMFELDVNHKKSLIGKNMVDFRGVFPNMLVVGISRHGKVIIPHGNDVIKENDIIYIVGKRNDIIELEKEAHQRVRHVDTQNVMIIGGGKTGYFLSKRLAEFGCHVKVIEKDKARCHYLANKLDNVLVLHGDGADLSLLLQEGLEEMDAFITATSYDEENLLLALTAKDHGVEDVISKVSHDSYKDLIDKLGIDVVLNPLDICASAVLRSIKGKKRVLSSVILQGQAELMEIWAEEKMGIVGVPLKNLSVPDTIIIAVIRRGAETIIPNGDTVIKAGDRVILVSLLSHIGYVEKLIKETRLNILK